MSTTETGKPGKYQRSGGGLVAALVVTVIAIVVVMSIMRIFRDEPEVVAEEVEYLEVVAAAQREDVEVVYPATLPDGWTATGAEIVPGDDEPGFDLRLLTDDDKYVGVHVEDSSPGALLSTYVDDETTPGGVFTVDGSVATEWEAYTDEGGDTAYVAELPDHVVLVYGSAPAADLQDLVEALTTEPVEDSANR